MAARNRSLDVLDVLVGEWEMTTSVGGRPLGGRGRTEFGWQGEGFLSGHSSIEIAAEAPPEWRDSAPTSVDMVIGLDDTTGCFSYLYADDRGVHRVYEMRLADGQWRIERAAPGFHQRFTATVAGDTITGRWEFSPDGTDWSTDFDLTYHRIT